MSHIPLQVSSSSNPVAVIQATLSAVMGGDEGAVSQPFMRAKLLLVGRGRAGKTSTVKSLLSKPFDAKEASTIGCNTKESTASLERVDATCAWRELNEANTNCELNRVLAQHVALQLAGKGEDSDLGTTDGAERHRRIDESLSTLGWNQAVTYDETDEEAEEGKTR